MELLGTHNEHLAETGRLGAEAVLDASLVVEVLKLATNRERPNEGNGQGGFWPHGISKTTLKHVKNFLSGIFRHAAQQEYFDGASPVKLAEIPAFALNGAETKPYSLEEIAAMLKVLSEPSATAVATAAFTGLRLGELRGLTWASYEPAQDEESFGWLNVTQAV